MCPTTAPSTGCRLRRHGAVPLEQGLPVRRFTSRKAPLAHCVRGMTCSGVRERPTVRDAQPGIIDAALNRSRLVASGNWFAFAASDHIRADRPFGTSVGGTEIVAWRDSGHRVACRAGRAPALGR